MSNRKKAKRTVPLKAATHYVLTEENKHAFAIQLGYPLSWCDEQLAKAKEQGYDQIRFPIPPRG